MKTWLAGVLLGLFPIPIIAQNSTRNGAQTSNGPVDMASAMAQRNRSGSSLPSTCTFQYEQFLLTGSTPAIYYNTSTTTACNWVPQLGGGGSAGQIFTSANGFIDFSDVMYFPTATCSSGSSTIVWSGRDLSGCRNGTNSQLGFLLVTTTNQFQVAIPEDWNTSANPYIRFQVASTDAISGRTIIPEIQVSCENGDGTTTDDVAFNAVHVLPAITLNATANQFWSTSNTQMNATDMTGCVPGSMMIVLVRRATDTATNARFYGATVTIPRRIAVQAN